MRSYSRNSPATTCERLTAISGLRAEITEASFCSLSRSTCPLTRATAIASASGTVDSESPSTPIRIERSTRGSGRSAYGSYSEGRSCLAISMMSSKPESVTSAVRAPFRSRSAFVATVVPCTKTSTVDPHASSSMPTAIPSSWCSEVGIFAVVTLPSTTSTKSVNVPPTSAPSIIGDHRYDSVSAMEGPQWASPLRQRRTRER